MSFHKDIINYYYLFYIYMLMFIIKVCYIATPLERLCPQSLIMLLHHLLWFRSWWDMSIRTTKSWAQLLICGRINPSQIDLLWTIGIPYWSIIRRFDHIGTVIFRHFSLFRTSVFMVGVSIWNFNNVIFFYECHLLSIDLIRKLYFCLLRF